MFSPKLTSNDGNPLLDFMFTADPTAVEYKGRIYVYATNDHQQYEKVGKDGKNSYEHIRTLVMMSSDDMVNWTSWPYQYSKAGTMESEFLGAFHYIQARSRC